MKYNISKTTPPVMPHLGKGTESIQLLLSQVSKDMHQPVVPMLFPILGAHISGAEFMYSDHSWKETCGMMANLVAESGAGKGQLSGLLEAICRDFRQHDEEEFASHRRPPQATTSAPRRQTSLPHQPPAPPMSKEKWNTLLNLIVTIITAIAASLTTQSCMGL